MNNKKFFLDKLPQNAQKLFHSDPKLFQKKYQNDLYNIIKQDLLYLVEIATPVHERIRHSAGNEVWYNNELWYCTTQKNKNTARYLLSTYGDEKFKTHNDFYKQNYISATNKELFKILRIIFFYINYEKPTKWDMSNIKPLNQVTFGEDLTIVVHDFINRHNNIKKINYTKPELEQQIATGCENIANKLINTEIERICEINRQIKQAKEILAKYGTELVRGY